MRAVRVLVVYLLALALIAPAWASAFVPCMAMAGQNAATEEAFHRGHHEPEKAVSPDSRQPVLPDCTCCDGCAEACPFTGCSTTAVLAPEIARTLHSPDHDVAPLKIGFYPGPQPHPLFRPPI